MNGHAYEPPFNAEAERIGSQMAAASPEEQKRWLDSMKAPEPPAPPRMRITPGEGGLGPMFAALAKAQAAFEAVKANAHVEVQTRDRGSYKFNYAPLENVLAACVPALNANGFFFSQPLYSAADGEGYVLRTCLFHEKGGSIELETYIPKPEGRIQDLGSAITYQRRYVAQALFGVNSEDDDDGAGASGDKIQRQPQRQQPSPQPPRTQQQPPKEPAPAAGVSPPATSAPPVATTPEPANDGPRVERDEPLTPEQHKVIGGLFKQLVPKVSAPMATKIVLDVTGKSTDQLTEGDGLKLKAYLEERIAKQGAAS